MILEINETKFIKDFEIYDFIDSPYFDGLNNDGHNKIVIKKIHS